MAEADFQWPKGATPNFSHSIGGILRGSFHLTGAKKKTVNESLGVGCHWFTPLTSYFHSVASCPPGPQDDTSAAKAWSRKRESHWCSAQIPTTRRILKQREAKGSAVLLPEITTPNLWSNHL